MYKPGPLSPERQTLAAKLAAIPLKTGDLLFRTGSETIFGVPFSPLVAKLTRSKFSHASVVLVEPDDVYLVEVGSENTLKLRLIDWLELPLWKDIAAYRPVGVFPDADKVIREFLQTDPAYAYDFEAPKKFYCTESACYMMRKFGVPDNFDPKYAREVLPAWVYYMLFIPINGLIRLVTGGKVGFHLDHQEYFVGNGDQGMLSSPDLVQVWPDNVWQRLLTTAGEYLDANPLDAPGTPKEV